jgi:dTDP-4-amino-4,6-dideoxygalactose transaminase
MIAMNDFKAEPEELVQAELHAVERVLRSGHYILGPEVEAFERSFAERCGVAHAVGVGNGMDAIEIGLRALHIGPGDEVITTPMTAFATTLAVIRAGATPVFADIDPETALLDLGSAERCLSPRTRALLPVHLYGRTANMDDFARFAATHRLLVLEDCAQAHGSRFGGRPVGAFGAFGAFSFYPTKNLGAIGDGGMLVTGDAALAEHARRLRNYGQSQRYHHPELGLNSRLDELQAAVLSERLRWLDRFTARRREIASMLRASIHNPAVRLLATEAHPEQHVHHLFVLACERRDALAAELERRGVKSLSHYPVPLHHQPPCRDLPRDPHGLPAAETHAARCLSIPCHPQMSEADVEAVATAVNAFA